MGGKTLVPGMIDAHGHVMGLGAQILQLDPALTDYQFCHASPTRKQPGRRRREKQEGSLP